MPDLTPRQLDILRLVAEGRSNKQIAATLKIRPCTVRNYMTTILGLLGCENRTQLALWAVREGIV